MPVTGQDAVRDRPAVQRKAEMRASIVDREAARSLADYEEWATGSLDKGHPPRFEILEVACMYPGAFSASIGSGHCTPQRSRICFALAVAALSRNDKSVTSEGCNGRIRSKR